MDPQEFIVGGDMVARNPYTGVQEFGFFSKVFKGIKKIVKKAAPIILGLTAAALTGGMVNPFTMGSISGGIGALGGSLATALSTTGGALTAGLVGGTTYGLARGKNLKDSLKRGAKVAAVAGAAQGLGAFDSFAASAPTATGATESAAVADKVVAGSQTAAGGSGAVEPSLGGFEAAGTDITIDAGVKGLDPLNYTVDASGKVLSTPGATGSSLFGAGGVEGFLSQYPGTGGSGFFSGMSPVAKTFGYTSLGLSVLPILLPQDVEQYQQESGIPLTQEDIDALTGKADAGPPSPAAIAFAKFYRDRQNYQGAGGQQVGGSGIPTLTGGSGIPTLMEGGEVAGPGTGTSDSIPALLSDGEFGMTAEAVRNAGGGSRRKGAAKMYKLMKNLEAV